MIVFNVPEFISKLEEARQCETLYVLGGWGYPLNDANKRRAIAACDYNSKRADMIYRAGPFTFAFDCVNLIKGILWGWSADVNHVNGGAVYGSNGVPDTNETGMINKYCYDVSDVFSNIVPGEYLWIPGHCGVYIGNGKAIECTPAGLNRVQYSNVLNVTKLNSELFDNSISLSRSWRYHAKLPWIDYSAKKNGVVIEDGEYFLYKNGVQIVDAGEHFVDGWHWIDDDGTVAHNKDVWIPYIMADEEPGSTEGKWCRFDSNGDMVYGWSAKNGRFYYFDPITGAMAKGKQLITSECVFDTRTGEMINLDYAD